MPSNSVVVNGVTEFEIPDSRFRPLYDLMQQLCTSVGDKLPPVKHEFEIGRIEQRPLHIGNTQPERLGITLDVENLRAIRDTALDQADMFTEPRNVLWPRAYLALADTSNTLLAFIERREHAEGAKGTE